MITNICPRCNFNGLQMPLVRNSLSRRDNKTYICNMCGNEEALFDLASTKEDALTYLTPMVIVRERKFKEYLNL